jgi:hypothetical protein
MIKSDCARACAGRPEFGHGSAGCLNRTRGPVRHREVGACAVQIAHVQIDVALVLVVGPRIGQVVQSFGHAVNVKAKRLVVCLDGHVHNGIDDPVKADSKVARCHAAVVGSVADPDREQVRDLLEESPSGFGRLTAVTHAAKLERTPAYWALPSMPLGSHSAVWIGD